MRAEKEILNLILDYANHDDNIRMVVMNGSRANPNACKDPFQDYDIACLVRDVKPYLQNKEIPASFGEVMIFQTPDDMQVAPPGNNGHYAFLMQFVDGTRIDLSFHTLDHLEEIISDSLSVLLLDKDRRIHDLPSPSEASFYPEPPTEKLYFDCCNEFWWVTPYVAKGLWRDQLIYAHYHLDSILREKLMEMLVWYFGIQTHFQKSPGKSGKFLQSGIDREMWALLERTYADAQPEHMWDALLVMGELFRQAARCVAAQFCFSYPELEDRKVTEFIRDIRNLSKNAETIC